MVTRPTNLTAAMALAALAMVELVASGAGPSTNVPIPVTLQ